MLQLVNGCSRNCIESRDNAPKVECIEHQTKGLQQISTVML